MGPDYHFLGAIAVRLLVMPLAVIIALNVP
jgi:hypothetical protein